jgi:hypothetical protein
MEILQNVIYIYKYLIKKEIDIINIEVLPSVMED